MNIYEKLAAVQQELKAPKDKYNSFGEYHYRSAEGILEAVKPLLAKYSAMLHILDDIETRGDKIFVKSKVTIISIEEPSEHLSAYGWAELSQEKKKMDASQLTGVASSYARKYAFNALFLIDDTKDADTDEYAKQNEEKQEEKPKKKSEPLTEYASEAALKTIKIMVEKAGLDMGKILNKPLEELTANEAVQMILALKKRLGED